MPKGSEKLTNARRQEIIDACEQLYEVMPFKDITLGEIGAKTSFTRTSIYNYFRTKEEIFLALLEREFRTWSSDLASLAEQSFPQREFASRFAEAAGWKISWSSKRRTKILCRLSHSALNATSRM